MNSWSRGIAGVDSVGMAIAACIGSAVCAVIVGVVIVTVFAAKKVVHPVRRWISGGGRGAHRLGELQAEELKVEEVKASPVAVPLQNTEGVAVQAPGAESVIASPKSSRMKPPRGGLVTYQGVLRGAGIQRRTGVQEPYDCYCVTIADQALGHDQQLWGIDLERAVEASGAAIGDSIKVALVGETPVHFRGKTTYKKVWSVEKV